MNNICMNPQCKTLYCTGCEGVSVKVIVGVCKEDDPQDVDEAYGEGTWERLFGDDSGQDIAEYAVLLAVILVIVIGTIRLIGTAANNTFSAVASSISDGGK